MLQAMALKCDMGTPGWDSSSCPFAVNGWSRPQQSVRVFARHRLSGPEQPICGRCLAGTQEREVRCRDHRQPCLTLRSDTLPVLLSMPGVPHASLGYEVENKYGAEYRKNLSILSGGTGDQADRCSKRDQDLAELSCCPSHIACKRLPWKRRLRLLHGLHPFPRLAEQSPSRATTTSATGRTSNSDCDSASVLGALSRICSSTVVGRRSVCSSESRAFSHASTCRW